MTQLTSDCVNPSPEEVGSGEEYGETENNERGKVVHGVVAAYSQVFSQPVNSNEIDARSHKKRNRILTFLDTTGHRYS